MNETKPVEQKHLQSIGQGHAECINEPMGRNNLEGFTRGSKYYFMKVLNTQTKKEYFRIWLQDPSISNYYETCGPRIFKLYFKEI